MNIKRSSDFINIKHKIQSCTKLSQIESLSQLVHRFIKSIKSNKNNEGLEIERLYTKEKAKY